MLPMLPVEQVENGKKRQIGEDREDEGGWFFRVFASSLQKKKNRSDTFWYLICVLIQAEFGSLN